MHEARVVEFPQDVPDAAALYNEGAQAAQAGDFTAAAKHFAAAAEVDPDSPRAHGSLGAAYARLERFAEACAAYERALELAPRLVSVHLELAGLYERRGDLFRTQEHLRTFLSKAAGHAKAPEARRWLERIS